MAGTIALKSDTDLFEMTNLLPRRTGPPMTVWVGPPGRARRDIRVKVNPRNGGGRLSATAPGITVTGNYGDRITELR